MVAVLYQNINTIMGGVSDVSQFPRTFLSNFRIRGRHTLLTVKPASVSTLRAVSPSSTRKCACPASGVVNTPPQPPPLLPSAIPIAPSEARRVAENHVNVIHLTVLPIRCVIPEHAGYAYSVI